MNSMILKRQVERIIDDLPPELLPEVVDFLGLLRKRSAAFAPGSELTEDLLSLTAEADPVLAELWDNEKDAAYDQL